MHCVNCASDDADHPLVEWVSMVQELRQPRAFTTAAHFFLDHGTSQPFLRWVMRPL